MEKIKIFDTTLRDGEQSPGASLAAKEKLEIARELVRLKADIIEAGFPVSSPGDFKSVKEIASKVKGPVICGLARSRKADIDACYNAVKASARPRIHVFLATSRIHMKYKLKKAGDEILKQAVEAVRYARSKLQDVEFSPEDASRTEREFLFRIVEAVIDAGAITVNIPDTVGYAVPSEFGGLVKDIRLKVANIEKATLSVHCHNDLGLAVSNSLAAVINGARQVECTINGLGERAGNASLEEIVMALDTRKDIFGVSTSINKKEICKASKLVSDLTGIRVQPNKAIVGKNAFSHEAGIHQDGVLKKRATYEIMKPSDVGFGRTRLVLGKHSGRHAFKARLNELGFHLKDAEINRAFQAFKKLADKKKDIFDDDLVVLADDQLEMIHEKYKFHRLKFTGGTHTVPEATVSIKVNKKIISGNSRGDGPVDASYKAIEKITGVKAKLLDYSLRAVTGGKDAIGEVIVRLRAKHRDLSGRGASTDIIEASVKAYLNAVNKAVRR